MPLPFDRTPLVLQLANLGEPEMYGNLVRLRGHLEEWLSYVPHIFPHYTRHTIGHSDEIVRQLSAILYDGSAPAADINLSAAEIYCLVASAYLHDAGMVASSREFLETVESKEWRDWTTEGPGEKRWAEIQAMMAQESQAPSPRQRFAIDLEARFLFADYVRRQHHTRAGQMVRLNSDIFADIGMGSPMVTRTIADICEGHGLSWQELSDNDRYPFRRDLPGGPVNVRLMAILLRLGDLLDMSSDRACPLLLAAAAPLPPDSIAHWTQYQRIVHRLTAPDRIEITAECATHAEHRVIHDWLQWIAGEATNAPSLLHGSSRHPNWKYPLAQLDGPAPTLVVRPAAGATYVPADWTFQLDHETVLQRLMGDTYADKFDFVRELIQNAADANRCELRRVHGASDDRWPRAEDAAKLEISVSIDEATRTSPASGEEEKFSVITVRDHGIGMDAHVIQKYLLQVGVSYYTSAQFRREYGFVSASRFGIGFLSVFAVSDEIVVETYKPTVPGATPLKLTLTGPRNYILLEHGSQAESGTTVRVVLRSPVNTDVLKHEILGWCRLLEFPVTVIEDGRDEEKLILKREDPKKFERQLDIDAEKYDQYRIRAIPLSTSKIRGSWYLAEVRDRDTGRWRWDISGREVEIAMRERKFWTAELPRRAGPLLSLHGISAYPRKGRTSPGDLSLRLDYRTSQEELPVSLNRSDWNTGKFPPDDEELYETMLNIVERHFGDADADMPYRQRVSQVIRLPRSVLNRIPNYVRLMKSTGDWVTMSLADLARIQDVIFLPEFYDEELRSENIGDSEIAPRRERQARELAQSGVPVILEEDTDFEEGARTAFIQRLRVPSALHRTADGLLAVTLSIRSEGPSGMSEPIFLASLEGADDSVVMARLNRPLGYGAGMTWLNTKSSFYKWLAAMLGVDFPDGSVIGLHSSRFGRFGSIIGTMLPGVMSNAHALQGQSKSLIDRMLDELTPPANADMLPPRPTKSFNWHGRYLTIS